MELTDSDINYCSAGGPVKTKLDIRSSNNRSVTSIKMD